jgi:hypothetical protein
VVIVVLLGLVVVFGVLIATRRRAVEGRREAARTVDLKVDGWGVKRWLADGRYEEVSWAELQEVRAVTLPKGPWESRLRFVLDGGGERGCIVAGDLAESNGLVERLSALPGFDIPLLGTVLDGDRNGTRVLWRRTST